MRKELLQKGKRGMAWLLSVSMLLSSASFTMPVFAQEDLVFIEENTETGTAKDQIMLDGEGDLIIDDAGDEPGAVISESTGEGGAQITVDAIEDVEIPGGETEKETETEDQSMTEAPEETEPEETENVLENTDVDMPESEMQTESVTELSTESEENQSDDGFIMEIEEAGELESALMLLSAAAEAPEGTLQYRINQAIGGTEETAVIQLEANYKENLVIPVGKSVEIDLNGHTIAPAADSQSLVQNAITVYGSLLLRDSTGNGALTGAGGSSRGVMVIKGGSFTFESGAIKEFHANGKGAGVYVQGGAAFKMNGGSITGNTANDNGGGIFAYDGNTVVLNSGVISSNTAENGGGIAVYSLADGRYSLTAGRLTVENNTAAGHGGGIYVECAANEFNLANVVIQNNQAGGNGGGVAFVKGSVCSISNITVNGNQARYGGGIYVEAGSTLNVLDGSNITENISSMYGAGIRVASNKTNGSTFSMTGGTVTGNEVRATDESAIYGGGISVSDYSTVTIGSEDGNVTISGNKGATYGGGVSIGTYSTVVFKKNVEIANNETGGIKNESRGAGIYVGSNGNVTVSGTVVRDNKAKNANSLGGGICSMSPITIEDAEIYNNTATGHGGGVYGGSSLTIENGEIYENTSTGHGGGVYAATNVAITGGCIWDNTATLYGGGIYAATVDMSGGIIGDAENGNQAKCAGGIYANTVKLSGDALVIGNQSGDSGGGGIYAAKEIQMTGGTVSENASSSRGGGIWAASGCISGGQIIGNTTNLDGGGIRFYNVDPETVFTITGDVRIADNHAADSGGGVAVFGTLCMDGGTVTGNNSGANGGGIAVTATGYTATISGGAVYDNKTLYAGTGNDLWIIAPSGTQVGGKLVLSQADQFYVNPEMPGVAWRDEQTGENAEADEESGLIEKTTSVGNPVSYTFVYKISGNVVARIDEEEYPTVQEAVDAAVWMSEEPKLIQMIGDSKENVTIPEGLSVKLDLNGHSLAGKGDDSVIFIEKGAVLAILDGSEAQTGEITWGAGRYTKDAAAGDTVFRNLGGGLYVAGEVMLESGSIRGNQAIHGGGVYVAAGGKFTMAGGCIANNTAANGGGVHNRGEFLLVDGTITGNRASLSGGIAASGGGVTSWTTGSFQMKGGLITGNTASDSGGGIDVYSGSMVMTGGTISGNQCKKGGGIQIYCRSQLAEVTINGGKIENNVSSNCGGGINLEHASGKSVLNLNGGILTGNTAATGGGIYLDAGTAKMTGGAVTGNKATTGDGGGIYVKKGAQFTAEKGETSIPQIYRNESTQYGRDIHAETDCTLNLINASDMGLEYDCWKDDLKSRFFEEITGKTDQEYRLTAAVKEGAYNVARIGETKYTKIQNAVYAAGEGETIHLTADHTESVLIPADKKVVIDLNGFTLTSEGTNAFYVLGNLTLQDEKDQEDSKKDDNGEIQTGTIIQGSQQSSGRGVLIAGGGRLTMKSGTITGFKGTVYGGAVYAMAGGSFEMKGGNLSNNQATYGGAVYLAGNNSAAMNFTMSGGAISENEANVGGGIYINLSNSTQSNRIALIKGEICGNMAIRAGNQDATGGGGVYLAGCNNTGNKTQVQIGSEDGSTEMIFSGNVSKGRGGGLYLLYVQKLDIYDGARLSSNSSNYGGGGLRWWNAGTNGSATIHGGVIERNHVFADAGGGVYLGGNVVILGGEIKNNRVYTTNSGGGILQQGGTIRLEKCMITGNRAGAGGGASLYGTSAYIGEDVTISNNTAGASGGGVYISGLNGVNPIVSLNGTIENNYAPNGGGIHVYNAAAVTANAVKILGNTATGDGGGIYWTANGGRLILQKESEDTEAPVISGNTAVNGGGIFAAKLDFTLEINDGTVSGNIASNAGGGIYVYGSPFKMTGGALINNQANYSGGAVYSGMALDQYNSGKRKQDIITGGEISGNSAVYGGGISSAGYGVDTVMSGGVCRNNVADAHGGGIWVTAWHGHFTLKDDGKMYDNTAGLGQDIFANYSKTLNITDCSLHLLSASDMFKDDSGKEGIGWYDENRGVTITEEIDYDSLVRTYPLTLDYTNRENYVAEIVGGKQYTTVQDAVNAAVRALENGTLTGRPVIRMLDNSRESITIPGNRELALDLNGHTLRGITTAITCYGDLIIKDSTAGESGNGTGAITGTSETRGGGILVCSGGYVVLESGQVSGCIADTFYYSDTLPSSDIRPANKGLGAGVYCDYGTFEMKGGSINNCKSYMGAAVYVGPGSSTFKMSGGAVEDNRSAEGAVYVAGGTFLMTNGEIRNNLANSSNSGYGGGVYILSGDAFLYGGRIAGNQAYTTGGGVRAAGGTTRLRGVTIEENTVLSAKTGEMRTGGGGGVAVYNAAANVFIYDGTVIRNNTARRGGGVHISYGGTVRMLGGQISQNAADAGGGVVQYAENRSYFYFSGGMICDNVSKTTTLGNDVYSAYEGTGDYSKTGLAQKPVAVLQAAADMNNDNYNVWHDDTYTGSTLETEEITKGLYITGNIAESYGLQLTAALYGEHEKVDVQTQMDLSIFAIETLAGGNGMADGTSEFDTAAAAKEIAASEKMGSDGSELDESYEQNGVLEKYIQIGGSKYEQDQAVNWSPGDDSGSNNSIVCSYDTVTYTLHAEIRNPDQMQEGTDDSESGAAEGGADDEEVITEPEVLKLWMEAELDCSIAEAQLSGASMAYSYLDEEIRNGKTVQILRGYWTIKHDQGSGGVYNNEYKVTVNVRGMKNGDTLKPVFKAWLEGSRSSAQGEKIQRSSKRLTVSAAPRYNVVLKRNNDLAYTSYFNLNTGEEASKAEIEAFETKPKENSHIVYGTMLGYGITLELDNVREDRKTQSIKGNELPAGNIGLDVTLGGTISLEGELVVDDNGNPVSSTPYLWAYKENTGTGYGTSSSGGSFSYNMDWNDEDDLKRTTCYAYDAAPYNSGSGDDACYSGGSWQLKGSSSSNQRLTMSFNVSGYSFGTGSGPSKNSDGVVDKDLNKSYIRAFSAGYVQVIYPIDPNLVSGNGYMEVNMEAAVSNLDITSMTNCTPANGTAGMDLMQEFFGNDYISHAVNEVDYSDNYLRQSTGLYVFRGDGNSDALNKKIYFEKSDGNALVRETGTGSTALGSQVYIGSAITYISREYDTLDESDPHYNPSFDKQQDNRLEYNYMTAMNLLQKFDADAYTPVGCDPVVNVPSSELDKVAGFSGAFTVSNNETATTWSSTKTKTYNLTILYAAKPDGSNWDKTLTDGKRRGGEIDMDKHKEEDLIYFTSLDDLYQYFGIDENGNRSGNCVGILYQIRDCCIRRSRSFTIRSRMDVTDEFAKVGDTYCTTNDVRCWSTYRPEYKKNYAANTLAENGLLYQFDWRSVQGASQNGITAYGNGSGKVPEGYAAPEKMNKTVLYYDGYWKTEYWKTEYDENGFKVNGSHTGWYSGNTLLVYTMQGSVFIQNTDIIKGGNSEKSSYNISSGERLVNYRVSADIVPHSDATKNPLVLNGAQSTDVEITLNLPKYLNYNKDSVWFDYDVEGCGYAEDELSWEIKPGKNEDGTSTLVLTTHVTDISKKLPEIKYSCTIGSPETPSEDIPISESGYSLTTVATIKTSYSQDQISGASERSEVTIRAINEKGNAIYISSPSLVEIGSDLEYTLHYSNSTESPLSINLCDVLPFNGDGRGTSFDGGYRVKGIELIFEDEQSYNAYKDTNGVLKYQTGVSADSDAERKALLTSMKADTVSAYESVEYVGKQEDGFHVKYDMTKAQLTQLAQQTEGGIGFYAQIPLIGANSGFRVKVILSPVDENGELIKDQVQGSKEHTQSGNNVYMDNFFYEQANAEDNLKPIVSGTVSIRALERTISGLAWMDLDQDGLYTIGTGEYASTDRLMKGIEVYLYTSEVPESREAETITIGDTTYYQACDILGNLVKPAVTDAKGSYTFTKLPSGTYFVYFSDANGYQVATACDSGASLSFTTGMMPFGQLSVTPARDESAYTQPARDTDKAVPYYNSADNKDGPAALTGALVKSGDSGIKLPALEDARTGHYVTGRWNCGFYYLNLTLEKQWLNVRKIPEGTKVKFNITAEIFESGEDTASDSPEKNETQGGSLIYSNEGSYTFTQNANGVGLNYTGATLIPQAVVNATKATVSTSASDMAINWKVTNQPLQAEGSNGIIEYTFQETAEDKDGNSFLGFVMTQEDTEDQHRNRIYKATNTQLLYEFDITKISTSTASADYSGQIVDGHPVLSNAEFTLYSDPDCKKPVSVVTPQTSKNDGIAVFRNLEAGTYYLKETKAPSGYALNNGIFEIQISYAENEPITPSITVKQMNDTENSDTPFEDGKVVITPDPEDIPEGTKPVNYTIAFRVADACLYSLPQSGGIGTLWNTFAGVAIMLTALLLLKRRNWAAAGDDSQAA